MRRATAASYHSPTYPVPLSRLDHKRKELLQEKEALFKESKAKLATMESVKSHIDTLMKTSTEVQKVHNLVQPIPAASDSQSSPTPS